MAQFHVWAAIRTIKDRIGTWAGFDKYSEFDADITREEWAEAIGEARAIIASRNSELTRPLNRRPSGPGEIDTYSVKKGTGYIQQVEIFVKDRDTGLTETRHMLVKTQTLRSRQSIVNEALTKFRAEAAARPDDYPEDILGAQYVGTRELVIKP